MSAQDRAASSRVADQLNEILLDIRKSFGSYGLINWTVTHVEPDVITVRFNSWPASVSCVHAATNVRNAMLNLLRDVVPCARFCAVFTKSNRSDSQVDLDFYPPEARDLPSNLIVIEDNAAPQREHWRALLDRAAGSPSYFTRAQRHPRA